MAEIQIEVDATDFRMPGDIAAAVRRANDDPGVHVIALQGAGRAFCSGYDLKISAEDGHGTQGATDGKPVWDPIKDFAWMQGFSGAFFTLHDHLRAALAPHKTPRHWYLADAIPANSMGEIQKFLLRRHISDGSLKPLP